MLEFGLARHGQSYANLDRSFAPDTDLTDLGRDQATRLGNWLVEQGHALTALYYSTLRRARYSAEISNEHFRLEVVFDADLCEAERPYQDNKPLRAGPLGEDPSPLFEPKYEGLCERAGRSVGLLEIGARFPYPPRL